MLVQMQGGCTEWSMVCVVTIHSEEETIVLTQRSIVLTQSGDLNQTTFASLAHLHIRVVRPTRKHSPNSTSCHGMLNSRKLSRSSASRCSQLLGSSGSANTESSRSRSRCFSFVSCVSSASSSSSVKNNVHRNIEYFCYLFCSLATIFLAVLNNDIQNRLLY